MWMKADPTLSGNIMVMETKRYNADRRFNLYLFIGLGVFFFITCLFYQFQAVSKIDDRMDNSYSRVRYMDLDDYEKQWRQKREHEKKLEEERLEASKFFTTLHLILQGINLMTGISRFLFLRTKHRNFMTKQIYVRFGRCKDKERYTGKYARCLITLEMDDGGVESPMRVMQSFYESCELGTPMVLAATDNEGQTRQSLYKLDDVRPKNQAQALEA